MNRLKNIKHQIYKKAKRCVYKRYSPRGIILMYHRIGNRQTDPWELFVSKENFTRQLEWLKHSFCVRPLSELDQSINTKNKKYVFITFDDGCFDNFNTAVPLLKKFHLPATFFIPTGILSGQSIFWWEALDFLFWEKDLLSDKINLTDGKNFFSKEISPKMRTPNILSEDLWSANRESAPTERCRLYLELCDWIRIRTSEEQIMITDQLIKLIENPVRNHPFFRKMSAEQIKILSKSEFEIGGHTVHHPALKFHDIALQKYEIMTSKNHLEKITGKKIISFSYPHGEYNEHTLKIMEDMDLKYACTTNWGAIYKDSNRLTMPRMLVRNTDATFFKKQLNYLFNS